MQSKKNRQIVRVKTNTNNREGNKPVIIVKRKIILDQIVEPSHNNCKMIREGTIIKENPLMGNVIIVERKITNRLNVKSESII